jgi:uncharacterized protein
MNNFEEQFHKIIANQAVADPAHDINHITRVVRSARQFAETENAIMEVVIPAAWLHDCVSVSKDSPDRARASTMAAEQAKIYLREMAYPEQHFDAIGHAIAAHSFSAGIRPETLEARVVQDADRIDAIGAIGTARCMMVAGVMNSSLYSENDPFCETREPNDREFAVDHFFAKLFKLQASFHTRAARAEADKRVQFMRDFLAQLALEI